MKVLSESVRILACGYRAHKTSGFRERKSRQNRQKVNGNPVPWSQQQEASADYLTNKRWAPMTITEEERQLLRDFEDLHPPSATPPAQFTMEELATALKALNKNEAPGLDGTRHELLLLLDYVGETKLLRMFNRCFTQTQVPQQWKESLMLNIYKSKTADLDPANYRPISLLSTFCRVYPAMIQKRLAK